MHNNILAPCFVPHKSVSLATYLSEGIARLTDINARILAICVRDAQFGDHAVVEHLISYCVAVRRQSAASVIYMQVNAFKRHTTTHSYDGTAIQIQIQIQIPRQIQIQMQMQIQNVEYVNVEYVFAQRERCNFITMFFTLQEQKQEQKQLLRVLVLFLLQL